MSFQLYADLAREGEVTVYFKVVNLDDFPGQEFYFYYQNYHYNYGYQRGRLDRIRLEQNKDYESSDRGDKTYLEVATRDGKVIGKTEKEIGGVAQNQAFDVKAVYESIRILSIEDGKIQYEIADRRLKMHNGKFRREDLVPGWLDNNRWFLYILIPAMAGLSLILLFMLRKPSIPLINRAPRTA